MKTQLNLLKIEVELVLETCESSFFIQFWKIPKHMWIFENSHPLILLIEFSYLVSGLSGPMWRTVIVISKETNIGNSSNIFFICIYHLSQKETNLTLVLSMSSPVTIIGAWSTVEQHVWEGRVPLLSLFRSSLIHSYSFLQVCKMNVIIFATYINDLTWVAVATNEVFEPRHSGPGAGQWEGGHRGYTAPWSLFLKWVL